jgi:DNA-binding winged helix-turn-helix (wHTH) protein/Flp pilus assembly protein TadD
MIRANPLPMSVFRVGDRTIDTSDGTIVSADRRTRLEPKVMAVLALLIERRGSVVSHDDLLRHVWPSTHVAPGALARTISVLRTALGDEPRHPRYIETLPKRGYRFIAEVEEDNVAPPHDVPRLWRRALMVAAVVVVGVDVSEHGGSPRPAPDTRSGAFDIRFRHDTRSGNEHAFVHYARAVTRQPTSADAHAGLARTYVFRANYLPDRAHWTAAALDQAHRAAALDPDNVHAVRALGMAHAQAGHLGEAIAHFRRALSLCPDDSATRTNLGRMLMMSGHVADALALFEQHAEAEPESAVGFAHVAGALAVLGDSDAAATAAHGAVARDPSDLASQMTLVRLDLLAARYRDARTRLEHLLEMDTECVQCLVQLGLVHQLEGDHAQAAVRYRDARAMAPQFASASLRLAQIGMLTGRSVEADALLTTVETAARRVIDDGVETLHPRWQLAAAAAIRGDSSRAIEWYRASVAAGHRDVIWDRWDPLLAAIHAHRDFVGLHEAYEEQRRAAGGATDNQ